MVYIKMNINLAFAPEGPKGNSPGQAKRSPGKGQQKNESPVGAPEIAVFHPSRKTGVPADCSLSVGWKNKDAARVGHPASRWFVLLLLACLTGAFAQAQTLSFTPGMVSALTTANSTTGSAANYTGALSGLVLNKPQGLTYDSQGDLFIVDAGANVVRVVASGKGAIPSLPSVTSPVAGDVYTVAGSGSGTPSTTQLCSTDEKSSIDSNYYGNGCPATDAILFFLTSTDYTGNGNQRSAPIGQVALDASGNLYIADAGDNQVRVVYAAGTVPGLTGTLTPGNIYAFAGSAANQSTTSTNPDGSLNLPPLGLAIDASGDVYIVFSKVNSSNAYRLGVVYNGGTLPPILAGATLTTGQYATISPLNSAPWTSPAAIALDSSWNIYISDSYFGTNSVYVIYAAGTFSGLYAATLGEDPVVGDAYTFATSTNFRTLTTNISTKSDPAQLAFNSAGDLYVSVGGYMSVHQGNYMAMVDTSDNLVLTAGNKTFKSNKQPVCSAAVDSFGDGCPANLVSMLGPYGVAAAPDGSINYVDAYQVGTYSSTATTFNYALHKIDGSASELLFTTTQNAGVASAAQTVWVTNAATESLNISEVNFPNGFTQVASGGTDCDAPITLTAGQSCELSVEFLPTSGTSSGEAFSGNVTLTSNSTNAESGVNSIAVSGTGKANTGTEAQSITFTPSSTATYGQSIALNGTASSGLTVIYQATGPARIKGSTLTVTGVGTITVTAYQPGNSTWAAATPVAVTITAQQAPLTVTANSFDQALNVAIPTLTYTITGFVLSDTQATATSGAPALSTTAVISTAGTYPITITQGTLSATNYSLTFVNGTFTVDTRSEQTITFTPTLSSSMDYGVSPITLTATASSGLAVTYAVTGPATVSGSTLTITGLGTVTVTASQAGNATYVPAQSVTQSFVVLRGPQTITIGALPQLTYGMASFTLSATSSSGGSVTFTVSSGNAVSIANNVLTVIQAGTATIKASVAGNTDYYAATATESITVAQAPLTITADNVTVTNNTNFSTSNWTYTISGFVNGDTSSVLSATPALSTTAKPGSPVGTYPITVESKNSWGDAVTATSYAITDVSGTLTITSGGPAQSFNMSLSSQSLTVLDGSSGQVTITIAPVNYYNGNLNMSCTGLPANAQCVFSPSPLNVALGYGGSSTENTKGTLTIIASSATVAGSLPRSGIGIYSAAIAGWASLIFGLVLAWQRKRLARHKIIWVLAMAVSLLGTAASLTACGAASTSYSQASPGTSTIQVVAADANGGPSNSTSLSLTITTGN
jgi:hypothetical protein